MSSKLKLIKNLSKRINYLKYVKKNKLVNYVQFNGSIPKYIRYKYYMKENKIHVYKIFNRSTIVNHCVFSGRSRSIVKNTRLTRMVFKHFALNGYLNGIRKTSW